MEQGLVSQARGRAHTVLKGDRRSDGQLVGLMLRSRLESTLELVAQAMGPQPGTCRAWCLEDKL